MKSMSLELTTEHLQLIVIACIEQSVSRDLADPTWKAKYEALTDLFGNLNAMCKEENDYTLQVEVRAKEKYHSMNETVKTEGLLNWLQGMLDDYKREVERSKGEDPYHMVHDKLVAMCACKDMVEAFAGTPVNLQRDGKVTTGF